MAILKHRASKNPDYDRVIDYMTFQYHKKSCTPVLDENGDRIPREVYFLDTINCQPDTFAPECRAVNRKWEKNREAWEIRTHWYILTYDPKDADSGRLTAEKAQQLGLEFARRHFSGHQVVVCTHPDGHNGSGNIHTHIVLNSVRKFDAEEETELCGGNPVLLRAGDKLQQSNARWRLLRQDVMEMCRREGLCQTDLLGYAGRRSSRRETMVQGYGQWKLDRDADAPARFRTNKEYLRDAVDECAAGAGSRREFEDLLSERYGVRVIESGGDLSFLHPDRKLRTSAFALGHDYLPDALETVFERNRTGRGRIPWDEKTGTDLHHVSHGFDRQYDYTADPVTALYIRTEVPLAVQLQADTQAGIEAGMRLEELLRDRRGGYDREALDLLKQQADRNLQTRRSVYDRTARELETVTGKLGWAWDAEKRDRGEIARLTKQRGMLSRKTMAAWKDLRFCESLCAQIETRSDQDRRGTGTAADRRDEMLGTMARTVCWVLDHGYRSRDQLEEVRKIASESRGAAQKAYSGAVSALHLADREVACAEKIRSGGPVYDAYLSSGRAKAFRDRYEDEITAYEDAVKTLKEIRPDGERDSMENVLLRRADCRAELDRRLRELKYSTDQVRELDGICGDVDRILCPGLSGERDRDRSGKTRRDRTAEPERFAER